MKNNLDLHKMLWKGKKHSPKWWVDGDLPWYKDIQEIIWSIFIQVYD